MSTNISKQKRDALLDKINQIKNYISAAPQDENTANLLTYIGELTKEINGKKYGLVFEEHREKIDELLEENAPVLVEQEDLFIDNGGEMNFLIEGDNLAALKLLEKTHKGKIDVIYIDPPYNTGDEDFIYDDNYVDKEDVFRHSKWLSFMEKRLKIAQKLLSNDGIIFISISDIEVSQLRLICDEIFLQENWIATLAIEMSKTQGMKVKAAQDGQIVKNHEYILIYQSHQNDSKRLPLYDKTEPWDDHFNCFIFEQDDSFIKTSITEYIQSNYKAIYEEFDSYKLLNKGKIDGNAISKGIIISDNIKNFFYGENASFIYQEMACSIKVPEKIEGELKEGKIISYDKYLLTMTSGGKLRQYRNLKENLHFSNDYISEYCRTTIRGALWKGFYSDMMNVQKEGNVDFKNGKKPIRLMQQLLMWANKPNSTVLDFFAGSGSTGHSVLDLNSKQNQKQKFILCTNNENQICEKSTYQRLKNVIEKDKYPASLKYFKIDYLPIKDKMYYEYADELLEHVKELVELENAIDFNTNKSVAIVLDDDELAEFVENIADYPECKTLYMGHDVLTSYQQEQTIKAHGITINTVPDYYYRDLAN